MLRDVHGRRNLRDVRSTNGRKRKNDKEKVMQLKLPLASIQSWLLRDLSLFMGVGGMGEKMGGPEILATAKRGVLGKFFDIEGGLEILNR